MGANSFGSIGGLAFLLALPAPAVAAPIVAADGTAAVIKDTSIVSSMFGDKALRVNLVVYFHGLSKDGIAASVDLNCKAGVVDQLVGGMVPGDLPIGMRPSPDSLIGMIVAEACERR